MSQRSNTLCLQLSLAWTAMVSLSAHGAAVSANESDLFNLSLDDLLNVVVTAEKRTEFEGDVPVTVTVVMGSQLENQQLVNLESVQQRVPALTYRKGTTTANSALNLRGIGTISFSAASEPSTSTVVDGVVLARSGQAFADLYDVARIEVMPGPQGMLFGKNASAGVVNIVTRDPSELSEIRWYAALSDDQEFRSGLSVSGALAEDLTARFSGIWGQYEGNLRNLNTDSMVNGYDHQAARTKFSWQPGVATRLKFSMDYAKSDDDCCAEVLGTLPSSAAAVLDLGAAYPDGHDTRRINQNFVTRTKEDSWGGSVQLDHELPAFTLTSLSAVRRWKNVEYRDGDYLPAGASHLSIFELHDVGSLTFEQLSEEIRLTSPTGQSVEWLAGLFWWQVESVGQFFRTDTVCTDTTLPADTSGEPPCAAGASTFVRPSATAEMDTEFTNAALFANLRWNLADAWQLQLGLRHAQDDVSYSHRRVNTAGGLGGPGVRPENHASADAANATDSSGKFGVKFTVDERNMAYMTYTQGYKGPAFDVFFNMGINNEPAIDPERSDAYELGYKGTRLFGGATDINLALFHAQYDNFQANSFDVIGGAVVTRLTNAGSVETRGAELELLTSPTDGLVVSAAVALTDATIKSFNCPTEVVNCSTRAGEELPLSPDIKYNLGLDYRFAQSDWPFALGVSTNYAWQSEQYSGLGEDEQTKIDRYGLLNMGLALRDIQGRYQIALTIKNVLDESYTSLITPGGPGGSYRYHIPRDADRVYGVSLNMVF